MQKKLFRPIPIWAAVSLGALLVGVLIASPSSSNTVQPSQSLQPDEAYLTSPMCMRPSEMIEARLSSGGSIFSEAAAARAADTVLPSSKNVAPLRTIWEPGPNFSGVFVDTVNDEIVAIDNNHNQILTYARLANGLIPPLRVINGRAAQVNFPAAVFVNTKTDEIFAIDNEISDRISVHKRTSSGNVPPVRSINVRLPTSDKRYAGGVMHPFGIWGDPDTNELVTTTQMGNNIATWDMNAGLSGVPKRNIQGKKTGLADPRGVFIDKVHNEILVVTDGHGQGATTSPSIRVFKRDADGDVAPIRVIEGPATLLEYAGKGLYLDTANDEIFIATSYNAVLVFPRTATGNAAPIRVLSGALTGLDHPTGIFVDVQHNEMVVSNWENFSITVYPRTANGNVAPIRTIRASGDEKAVGLLRGRGFTLDRVNDEMWHLN